jgi:hypothetical protein
MSRARAVHTHGLVAASFLTLVDLGLMPQYHGGTNFGRSSGGPFIATTYDYDAPIDEYGEGFSVLELFVRPGMIWALEAGSHVM